MTENAIEALEKALKLNPHDENARRLLKELMW